MKIVVTGAHGFLGWHTRLRLHSLHPEIEIVSLGREELGGDFAALCDGATGLIHIAGVNRADTDDEVEQGNQEIAERLVAQLPASVTSIVFANSIQADLDNAYGRGKSAAGATLAAWANTHAARFSDVLLPNLFGEHGRPGYNSFVATFANRIAQGEAVKIIDDKSVNLLHVQDAAAALVEALLNVTAVTSQELRPSGHDILVSDVAQKLSDYYAVYQKAELPELHDRFDVNLFNTLRAAMFPAQAPFNLVAHSDARGSFFECAKVYGGQGQTSFSTTVPGIRRGDHYHLRKIERFIVIKGQGIIRLRKMLTDEIVEFAVCGDQPVAVDMPTGWSHSIENTGDEEMHTMFWINEIYNPTDPDTFFEAVTDAPVVRTSK